MDSTNKAPLRKPEWLRKRLQVGSSIYSVSKSLRKRQLHTICEEGMCPNIGECFSKNTATLLVMGRICTRNCNFCGVENGKPPALDPEEPQKVAEEIKELGLGFVVVTSVTRDDLNDGGAAHFALVTKAIRDRCPGVGIELLVPDFDGSLEALDIVLKSKPEVLSHNMETVAKLYTGVRPQADYNRSLKILEHAATRGNSIVKSGFMLGLGESRSDVEELMNDLLKAGCEMLTIGQYLAPSRKHLPVEEYIRPEVFEEYRAIAIQIGFRSVASGPFIRSSYLAENFYKEAVGTAE